MDHTETTWRHVPIDPMPGMALKRLRRAKGFSQAEVAAVVGVTGDHVSRFERGKVAIPVAILCAIAEAMEVEPSAFGVEPEAARAAPITTRTGEERDLLDAFRRIPTSEGRESAFQVVNAIGAVQEHASC